MTDKQENEVAILRQIMAEQTPPYIDVESAIWGAATALMLIREQEVEVSQYDLPCTCGHGNAYAPHHRETCPHNAAYAKHALDEALKYARQYWQFGNEPETQRALTILARAVEKNAKGEFWWQRG